jgi:uncharacterized protein (DUF488 family)
VIESCAEPLPILSVGYGMRELVGFISLLSEYGVEFVGDVRSVPYSRRDEFSRPALERSLSSAGMRYVFLGDSLGGRPSDPECYDADGHVDYERCRTNTDFLAGIERVERAYRSGHRLALMCSEARPTDCHRSKLLAEMLSERGVPVAHIDGDGRLVDHVEVAAQLKGAQLSLIGEPLGRSRRAYRVA